MLRSLRYLFLAALLFLFINQGFCQWEAQNPGYPEGIAPLDRLSIVDSAVIWSVGSVELTNAPYHGFSKTVDGGKTWTLDSIKAEDLDNFFFSYVFALSDSIAWVSMVDEITPIHRGRIFKTTDGGESWVHQATAYPDDAVIAHLPSFVYFFDENDGLTAGYYGDNYVTSDGGDTWIAVADDNLPDLIDGNERPSLQSIIAIGDSMAVYGTNKGRIFKTIDRGRSWRAYNVGLGNGSIFASFKDEMNGLATNPLYSRAISKTVDGGETWQTLPDTLPINSILVYVEGTENTYMYGSGDLPLIIGSEPGYGFTADDGSTWKFQSNMLLEPLLSLSGTLAWAAGGTQDGLVYKWIGPDLNTIVNGIRDTKNPESFNLAQNYPNPFNPVTVINYQLPVTSYVELTVFNILGQKVTTLVSGKQIAGTHQVNFNGSGLSGGVYFYRLTDGSLSETKRMFLVK